MGNLKFVILILLNTPFQQSDAGRLWTSGSHVHPPKKIEPRLRRAIDPSVAVGVLLRDKVSDFSKVAGDKYLSEAMEHMDAPSLLKLLGKLKEEYVGKAEKKDAEEVRNSFDKLMATLVTLSNGPKRSHSGPAEILKQLSEEEFDDEGTAFGGDYYNDDFYSDEETSSDPSLLKLQSWNRQLSSTDLWDW